MTAATSTRQTPKQARDALEHQIEQNWNGLLLNDYFNCDANAIQDLFAAERDQLAHPSTSSSSSSTSTSIPSSEQVKTPREEKRDTLEQGWNGLLLLDWLNCDTGSAMDLWAEERRQMEEEEEEEEVKTPPSQK